MSGPRAIETRFAGRRFRSRLEARWAVFFTEAKIPWDYEREGFALESGCYLPDFWLWPGTPHERIVEVKPVKPTVIDPRWVELAEETQSRFFLAIDIPSDHAFAWVPGNLMLEEPPTLFGAHLALCQGCAELRLLVNDGVLCSDGCDSREFARWKLCDTAATAATETRFESPRRCAR